MTFGRLISDFETLVTIFIGSITSKTTCTNLKILSKMQGSVGETRIFKKKLRLVIIVCMVSFACFMVSHLQVAIIRSVGDCYEETSKPFFTFINGGVAIYTAVQVVIVFIFCHLITLKYEYLSNVTRRTMEQLYIRAGGKTHQSLIKYTDAITLTLSKGENVPTLHQLEKFYQRLTSTIGRVNKTVGLSILAAIASSLFTTMYYLYRFSDTSKCGPSSSSMERIHYFVGVIFKSGKMLSYMLMGSHLMKASQKPLNILQSSNVVKLQLGNQLKVQTMMLQWSDSKGYLSAGGIVRVGLWLLAPILGSIITYLLVALQFKQSNLESIAVQETLLDSALNETLRGI